MFNNIKFEYVFGVLVLLILSAALFYFASNDKISIMIITVLTNAITGITTFLYTKHIPKDGE